MKLLTIDGRLGKDAKTMKDIHGKDYLQLNVANTVYRNKTNETDWYFVFIYSEFLVSKLKHLLNKGVYVIVSGEPIETKGTDINGNFSIVRSIIASNVFIPAIGQSYSIQKPGNEQSQPVQQKPSVAPETKEEPHQDLPF